MIVVSWVPSLSSTAVPPYDQGSLNPLRLAESSPHWSSIESLRSYLFTIIHLLITLHFFVSAPSDVGCTSNQLGTAPYQPRPWWPKCFCYAYPYISFQSEIYDHNAQILNVTQPNQAKIWVNWSNSNPEVISPSTMSSLCYTEHVELTICLHTLSNWNQHWHTTYCIDVEVISKKELTSSTWMHT